MPYQIQVGSQVVEFPDSVGQDEAQRILSEQFPATGEDIAGAMQDPAYKPSVDDYLKYEEYAKNKQTDWINTIAQSVDAAAGMIGGAISQGAQGAIANPLNYIEGAAQGTRQLYGLVAQSQDPASPLFKFKDLVAGTGTPESRYQQFLEARDFANTTARLERGEEGLVVPPELTNPQFVQGVSMILDPTLALPGIGEVFGAGKLATRAVGKGAQLAGEAVAGVARPLERFAGAAERMTAEALGMTPEGLRSTAATAGLAGALGIAPEAATLAAIPAGIRTTREAGEALARAGENLMTQPSRIGPLEAIGAAPGANLRQRMLGVVGQYGGDAALDASLRGLAGGIEGATVGTGLGFLSGGEEGAAAGLGTGAVQGAAGALGARGFERLTGKAAKEARAGDLGRFIDAQQDPTTKTLFERVRDQHGVDAASALMDLQGLVRGKFGDVDILYRSNAQMAEKFGDNIRGVQFEQAERPTIFINADIIGKGTGDGPLYTLGHELFHALEKTTQLEGGATEIKDALVGRWIQEGDTIRKLAEGAFNDAEIEARFNEYRDKLAAGNQQRADQLAQYDTIDKKAGYVASELAAEHFAGLLAGQKPDALLKGFTGITRQLLDAALTQNASRALADAAATIERTFGVKPTDSVLFPDLKQASPQVNAMLRDLLRARRKLDERITIENEGPGKVLKPQDVSNPIAAKQLVDLGVAEKMPDGSVRNLSDEEIRVREEKDTAAIRTILEGVPGARVVDGEILGRFSPQQLSAIEQSQAVSSRMKDKIRAVNAAMDAGNSIFLNYGAATRRVKNRLTGKFTSKYNSGIRLSQREVLPYSFYLSKADNPVIKAIDISKIRGALDKLTAPDGGVAAGLWDNVDGFMSDLAAYFTNLDAGEGARRSAEIFGLEKAKFLGDFVNEQEKGGRKFVRDFRLDRIGSTAPMDFRARISEDAIQKSKMRWMPAETIGDKSVINSEEGYRIISGAKHKLYGPDGKLLGIYDTQTQAERKADATQARLQPEVRQQQYPARDEGRQAAEAGRGDSALGRTQGQAEGGAVRQAGDVRFMPMSDLERSDLDLRISTRNPSAKRATENPLTEQLSIDLESITRTPGALPEIINTVGKYPGIRFERSGSVNRANDFIRFVANNLIYLHDSVIPEIRDRSKLWYDGARKLAEDWSTRFNTTREGVAGVIASLSPQKDWYQNVTLAERVFQVVKDRQNEAFTGPLEQWARTKMTSGQSPKRLVQDEVINGITGKNFSQLSDYEKAVFVRAFDEVNNTRTYPIVSPEGQMLDIARKADGTPATYAWGDFNSIAKAVKIAKNPNKKTISESLGFEHKVRSFYDNILLPNNPEKGDVTIDTHAVAAALMLPLAGSDVPVAHNFGQGVPGSSVYGTSGTYGIYADAYRLAAQERGILPREMQSITWEAIRGLFTPEFKTAQNKKLVENLWKEYKSGKVTLDETRQRIVDTAGGIRNPSWYGPGGGAVAENAPAAQPQKLPGAGNLGRPGANAGGGSAVPGGSAQEIGAQRYMPSDTDYLSAVQKGDTQAAQRMVDEAAKAAGYTVGPVFHGTRNKFSKFSKGDIGFHFALSKDQVVGPEGRFSESDPTSINLIRGFLNVSKPLRLTDTGRWSGKSVTDEINSKIGSSLNRESTYQEIKNSIKSAGFDGVSYENRFEGPDGSEAIIAFEPSQIKSAEPITRDDAGNVIPLSKRFQQTSEDIRYMPSDDEYLTAVKRGNTSAAQDMVDAAAKAAGYTVGPVYHGTPTGGFNVFDKRMRGETSGVSRQAFSFTTDKKAAEGYSKRLGDEAVRLDAGLRVANDAMRRFDDDVAAQEYFSSKGYSSVEDGMLPEFDWGSIDDVPEFIKELRGHAKDLKPINPDLASSFVEAAKVMTSTKAVPEVKRVFLRIPDNAPVFQATPATLGQVMSGFSAEKQPTKAGIVELPGNERIYYVADSSQVKLADPVTKDAQGNVIPLSKRFQASSEDIRFMPDYSGEHRAPRRDSGAPLDNLKGVYPDDVYGPNAARYYGHESGSQTDKAAVRIIQATKGKPDALVKVFRAIPKSIQLNEINPGDWITTIKSYAVQHGEGPLGGDYKILEKTVPAGDLYTDGNSIFEFGYDPKFMPQPDSAMPGAYSFPGGYRAIPGKTKGSLRLYGPAGNLIGIASSLDEAQRILRRKAKQ